MSINVPYMQATDGIFLSVVAGVLAACSVFVAKRYKLNASARLFVVTLLLVTFAGDSGQDALVFAASRVGGILLGVVIMLLLTVLVLPKSATVESLHCMDQAIDSLNRLNFFTWYEFLVVDDNVMEEMVNHKRSVVVLPGGDEARGASARKSAPLQKRGDHEVGVPLLSPDVREDIMECSLTEVYEALFDMEDNLGSAKSEILLSFLSSSGRPVFAPIPIPGSLTPMHMPWDDINEMSSTLRKVSRSLFSMGQALHDWTQIIHPESSSNEHSMLEDIAASLREVFQEISRMFPTSTQHSTLPMIRMFEAIKRWEASGSKESIRTLASMQSYRCVSFKMQDIEERLSNSGMGNNNGASLPEVLKFIREEMNDTSKSDDPAKYYESNISPEWYSLTLALKRLVLDVAELFEQTTQLIPKLPTCISSFP